MYIYREREQYCTYCVQRLASSKCSSLKSEDCACNPPGMVYFTRFVRWETSKLRYLAWKKKTREGKKHWKAAAPKQVRHLLERQYQEHDFTPIPNHKALVYSNTTCLHLPTDCNLHILGGCSKSRTWHGQFTRHTQRNKQHTESASAFSTV